ncbi:hypothetical protein RT42_GL001904 [Enterococcus cecorum DSM 20682 = ATCC 43198]|nr:hypothetical protein RT42_GL001904 [Enterococcus cecorum DSM 20682 = ATCC 43198]
MMTEGKIKDQTILEIYQPIDKLCTYTFNGKFKAFYSNTKYRRELGGYFKISGDFLNYEVELIPPEPKKYLVKFNMRGWKEHFRYLNYYKKNDSIEINSKRCTDSAKTHFTKDELQSIQPVREFLEDMEGKYELIEVDECD